jgi:hypothetical protein
MPNLKQLALKLLFFCAQFGFDPIKFAKGLYGSPRYLSDLASFRRLYKGPLQYAPCLHDRFEEGGATNNEYFWQDLLVARWIHEKQPIKHVDVGSRVDGFIAHVASFRELEVLDIRHISAPIPGVRFRQLDLMSPGNIIEIIDGSDGYCDSLSCLHALEHFGLGRYGDELDPIGYRRGLAHLAMLLSPNGTLYLATPLGHEHIKFNANWVFAPETIFDLAEKNGLRLTRFFVFSPVTALRQIDLDKLHAELNSLASIPYYLGIMMFAKLA